MAASIDFHDRFGEPELTALGRLRTKHLGYPHSTRRRKNPQPLERSVAGMSLINNYDVPESANARYDKRPFNGAIDPLSTSAIF
jgi:hypothetical protein